MKTDDVLLAEDAQLWTIALLQCEEIEKAVNRAQSYAEAIEEEAEGRGLKTPEHGDAVRLGAMAAATVGQLGEELRLARAACVCARSFAGPPQAWEEAPADPAYDPDDPAAEAAENNRRKREGR